MDASNEIPYSLDKLGDFVPVIRENLNADRHRIHYFRRAFKIRPDFDGSCVNTASRN